MFEAAELPQPFSATTRNEYEVPGVNDFTSNCFELALAVPIV
jgi:hypothetical protein